MTMRRFLMLTLVLAGLAGLVWYRFSPGMTVDRLGEAVRTGDRRALERLVDFDKLRGNLKRDLRIGLGESVPDNHPLADFGRTLNDRFVGGLVDAIVTPGAMAYLLRVREPSATSLDSFPYEIERDGPFRFRAFYGGDIDPALRPALVFELQGLAWRVVHIRVADLAELRLR